MKLIVLLLGVTLAIHAQAAKSSKAQKRPAAKAAPAEFDANGIPRTAKKISEVEYAFTDKTGKQWIYRRGPVGWSKLPAELNTAPVTAAAPTSFTVIERGDDIEFQRRGPTGVSKWTKKRADLDADERAALERAQAASKPEQE
jgi:hypothetical protein